MRLIANQLGTLRLVILLLLSLSQFSIVCNGFISPSSPLRTAGTLDRVQSVVAFTPPAAKNEEKSLSSTTGSDEDSNDTNDSSNDSNDSSNDSNYRRQQVSRKDRVLSVFSQSANARVSSYRNIKTERERRYFQFITLMRVTIPSVLAGVGACLAFPPIALWVASLVNDPGAFSVLSQDASQFVQNFLTIAGLLFSILVGQTYYFLYTQQESIYYALFMEVTEAKSLLEQVALVCQGRSMYHRCLESISRYVRDDLKMIRSDPAVLLSARPVDDPLESIMYMTSVGVPSSVYETVKSLREARAQRLGALQRKLPPIHMALLWTLAAVLIVSFPLLGAGTQTIGGYKLLTIEGTLFGVMTAGIVLTLRVVGELWRPAGGAYNVDAVLSVMVSGLEEELKARMGGTNVYKSSRMAPSPSITERRQVTIVTPANANKLLAVDDDSNSNGDNKVIHQQGANVGMVLQWLYQRGKNLWKSRRSNR